METENRYIETDLGNVAPNPRGNYNAEAAYEYLDLVVYQGGSYLCVADTSQGTAPEPGKTTAAWQVLTLPGDLTPEYVAMHDDVANKAASAAEDAASTAADRAAVADMKEDVEQLQREVTESTASAKADKESAAGYAAAAEASRKAAAEAEANVTAQVNGFDEHVASKTLDATEAIASAREKAVQVVDSATRAAKSAASSAADSASTATQAASTATSQATAAEAASKTATSAASETMKAAKAAQEDIATAKSNAIKAVQDAATAEKKAAAASAENAATSAESAKISADNAAQSAKSVEDASKQIEQNKKDVASLKEDIVDLNNKKITKFYASNLGELHIADSDNGKIQDMMIYGRSSQFTTTGKNLANGQNINCFLDSTVNMCGVNDNDIGMAIDVSKLTNVTISTRSIQDRYRTGCADTVPTKGHTVTCYNGRNKDGTKDSYTIDTTDHNYLIVNATKLEDIQIEKGSEATSYEPYTGGIPSPSPDYPQEIKRVVNPTVKVCGKNLWNPILGGYINGVDGSITETLKTQIAVTDFIKTNGKDITVIARNFSPAIETSYAYRIGFYNAEKKWIKNIMPSDGNKYSINIFNITGTEYIRVSAPHGIYDTIQIEKGSEATPYEPYTEQSVQLPYTLNAIPVTSGGNVTIDGQQYIADYVNVERGKLVKMVDSSKLDNTQSIVNKTEWLLAEPQEIDLTQEEVQTLKTLATYYPTTNIFINSEQLDGYTVFNYPISMQNGWNYVKQQLNDNRDYIYDMDLQSAEAYVNSEYAVALTELEV